MFRRGLLDLAIGAGVGLHAAVFLRGPGLAVAILAILSTVAGALWRRPYVAVLVASATLVGADLTVHPATSNPWAAPLVLVCAGSLGAAATWPGVVAGIAVLAVVSVASAALLGEPLPGWDVLWSLTVTVGVALAARVVSRAIRRARSERQRRLQLSATRPEEVARHAVLEERARLAVDVQKVVRAAVTAMRQEAEAAEAWDGRTRGRLIAVQEEGRRAMVELRRLLGLLRDAPEDVAPELAGPRSNVQRGSTLKRHTARWLDVAVAAALVGLALFEHFANAPGVADPWSILFTVVGAASVALRGRAPGVGAGICGLALSASALAGHPVGQGFWWIGVLGGLTWSALARREWWQGIGAAVMLAGAANLLAAYYPENLGLSILLLLTVAAAAWATATQAGQAQAEAEHVNRLSAERASAASRAVLAERLTVARDLHDTVSHAVVVMVVQAGAAEALADSDRAAATRCIEQVKTLADETVRDLDRLMTVMDEGALNSQGTSTTDLCSLVDRMRAGGLAVQLTHLDADADSDPTIYRVVQETLTNALRHAPNAQVRVTISTSGETTMVEVVDDGPGPAQTASRGYGLVGMTERVERLGGTFEAGPGPSGRGFRVRARVPIATRAAI